MERNNLYFELPDVESEVEQSQESELEQSQELKPEQSHEPEYVREIYEILLKKS